ncbi:MAG: glycosyltransferase family 4 protein [Acidobacteria bacterium]|nr:glycosyltransferase family 4 protein [Acidobacteriota bacterium]
MPIKTLHITNAFHQSSGGISTFYRALMERANRLGRQMTLVVPGDQTRTEALGEFTRIRFVKSPHAPAFDRRYRLLMPTQYLPFFAGELTRILREERPDLIEICDKYSVSWLAGLLRRRWLAGLPRTALVGMNCERMDDNVSAFLTNDKPGKLWSKFYLGNLYIPLFDYHIANSKYTAEELRAAMNPKHHREIRVLPMGAQIAEFAAAIPNESNRLQFLAQTNGDRQTRLLLYAGRLSPEKNLPLLLELMERLASENFRLVVAGSGPLADWLESESHRRVPGKVLLLGHVRDRQSLMNLYANCDAFVHPNPREPFGIAPLEAMAAGLPLVAPHSGGVLSYADETNSWLAEANAEAFASALKAVFDDASMRKDKLARARWTAQQYHWSDVADRFFTLYDELHADFPASRFAYQLDSTYRVTAINGSERALQ